MKKLHDSDIKKGKGEVLIPYALRTKYPEAGREFKWQYLFPSSRYARDPRSDFLHRYHISSSYVAIKIRKACFQCGITKHVSTHTFRHSFATHLLK